ncbi:hypothetical protein GN958_ATG05686 [Phytophthora infestans]|uniref:Uncharacterized protein n=1 Tax=Phytophthora infestans TaxID=4787 RepID=A0A8S9UXL6_PHYIN|nr:hypothetical protein GN958_ATG05686 [Phytophthora infestans]
MRCVSVNAAAEGVALK